MKRLMAMAMLLFVMPVMSACGSKGMPKDWKANVDVAGHSATLSVDVPGKKMGTDYHPHLRLNDGPEVMMYSPTYSFNNLKPGSYILTVQLADYEHKPFDGLVQKVPFEVK